MFLDPARQAEVELPRSLLRKHAGPEATEVYVRCRPAADTSVRRDGDVVARQTLSVYHQLREILAIEGARPEHVVRETVFFRNVDRDYPEFRRARRTVLPASGTAGYRPATIHIEQPPLDPLGGEDFADPAEPNAGDDVRLEILARIVIPRPGAAWKTRVVRGAAPCQCESCGDLGARVVQLGDTKHVLAGDVCGAPGAPFDEATSMFEVAAAILREEGLDFRSVVRTWIYLRDMERDYAELNRARRGFFRKVGVEMLPASTGIDGSPLGAGHNFVLGFHAIGGGRHLERSLMTTPTLNEAPEYGSDFSRGLRVSDGNKCALYVSGTASVDECGRTVHTEDFEAQVDRMLLNVEKLLERQGAAFGDMVSAMTYIKRASDAPTFRRMCRDRGIAGFPNVVVEAGVCRTDLLCEMEGIAILPRGG